MKNLDINEYKKKKFNNNLMLFFTGISRFSGKYAAAQIKNTNKNYNELNKISEIQKMLYKYLEVLMILDP